MSTLWSGPSGGAGGPQAGALGVSRLPICDFCLDWAEFHGASTQGRHVNMCPRHFRANGHGAHQRLVLVRPSAHARWNAA
jgi:hypothetical protein